MNQPEITQFLESVKTDLINSLQTKNITNAQNITITTNDETQQLQIPSYLQIVETGRGPTSKNAQPGNPPMIQRIQQWCQEKGIPAKAAWAIKKKIDKMGYPGKPGLLTDPLSDDNINAKLEQTLEQMADNISNQILNALPI
ncbi:hypothetical protein HDF19_21760 [Mucilaginibacter sp. E4BP6]|uniref:hypothetical protein n=1 Tax=Mucilaginibacter sp. E4BP6 TaxID=2723089 RepID=UPI0015CE0E54|nr:hypothetical protein [Mucilaginibacter sp. E4BP6]NYE67968.1 hypothetical protein [Mucilaginibacter sp. E4BP6]